MLPRTVADLSGKFHRAYDAGSGVLLLELDRAPVNAFHEAMWREYSDIFDRIGRTPWIRVVVLASSSDKFFTSGLDVKEAQTTLAASGDPARAAFHTRQHVLDFQHAISAPERIWQPVIVAISGLCLGLGIDISCACDIRYVSSATQLGILEVNVGLAADIGTLQRLPKIVGNDSIVRELALTGRMFGPQEAVSLGFASRVVEGARQEVVKEALQVAKTIASKSPVAVAGTKRMLLHTRDHSVADGLEMVAVWNSAMLQSEDTTKALKAAISKGKPTFAELLPSEKHAKL